MSGPKIRVTNPPYTEVFQRGYPPREVVPAFFQEKMNWVIREDKKGCKFLYKVRKTGEKVRNSRGEENKRGWWTKRSEGQEKEGSHKNT